MSNGKHARNRRKRDSINASTGHRWPNPATTYCYGDCTGLDYPHYRAEHDADHEAARELRARRAGGME